MARSFGANKDVAEDLVQEMYLRLYDYVDNVDRIMYNEKEVNTFFVYVTLRNLYGYLMKAKSRITIVEIDELSDELLFEEANIEAEHRMVELYDQIWESVDDWHWYDKKLFDIYHNGDMSIRKLSEETNISARSIWNTLDNGRKRIQEAHKEAYQSWRRTQEE
jgi:RNA polymerase sigma factor (sigma-70 family)